MKTNPFLLTDFYKTSHIFQYPKNTTLVYSNFTPRKSRLEGIDEMVFFGLQYLIKQYLIEEFNENFFKRPKAEVIAEYKRRIKTALGNDLISYEHLEKLHDLGYLPIEIKALPEGSIVPMKVPALTLFNTHPEFSWLTNFLETLLSAIIWQPSTSATLAHEYRKLLDKYSQETGMPDWFTAWQGHDFSFRGMSSLESAVLSGMGHLLSFKGTDTIPAIDALEQYYNADAEKELIGGSVAATEHSVMCAGSKDGEIETFKRLITEVYPTGIVSIVSDTWDLWKVCTEYVSVLKSEILARQGKVVIRPDSGDPVDILCGEGIPRRVIRRDQLSILSKGEDFIFLGEDDNIYTKTDNKEGFKPFEYLPKHKGVVELLWDVFGGTITSTGHKLLDEHIGAIYGDSITLKRAKEIAERLKAKGFASQVVLGIGSFTYQYNTRDTFGSAMKATYVEVDGEGREIFKSPITDDGTKKSATGLLKVVKDENGKFKLIDKVSKEEEATGELKTVFKNGKLIVDQTLSEIRARLADARTVKTLEIV
jgi:nicotinamide phosphoribosyltransferase